MNHKDDKNLLVFAVIVFGSFITFAALSIVWNKRDASPCMTACVNGFGPHIAYAKRVDPNGCYCYPPDSE